MTRRRTPPSDEVEDLPRKIRKSREILPAELTRRGFDDNLNTNSPECDANIDKWEPRARRRLGWNGLHDRQLKDLA